MKTCDLNSRGRLCTMSTPIYYDKDTDLAIVQEKRLAFIGYGNQGAAQSQNLRDSGVSEILIGNLDVASGYNVAFQLFDLPNFIDVIMVAPRMIGSGVRQRYLSGEPYPCFISVERDISGNALKLALSIGHGIGATRGAILSSAREEAALDLFSEQAIWPVILVAFRTAYKVLHEAGFSDEAVLYEMYLSKEPAEVFERIADQGLFGQLTLHSHTSQFGQLRALLADDGSWLYEKFKRVLEDDILSSRFAHEWSDVQAKGMEQLEHMRATALASDLAQADERVRKEQVKVPTELPPQAQ